MPEPHLYAHRKQTGTGVRSRWSPRKPRTGVLDAVLHLQVNDTPTWKYLPLILILAFIARGIVALHGDFIMHPDEIMQYLEPAHHLAFGNGILNWEFVYGARSWLVPGLIAGVLKCFDLVGLAEPFWYVNGIKLIFCAISLAIPLGMYHFGRQHFSETTARLALLAGAFWYELIGFAHKPMTEFIATALVLALLVHCVRPKPDSHSAVLLPAALTAFAAAIRLQYAPIALLLFGIALLYSNRKPHMLLALLLILSLIGVFDAVTWNSGLFHSYFTNARYNLHLREIYTSMPGWKFLWWLLIASTGFGLLCIGAALFQPRRYSLLLGLLAVLMLFHSVQTIKEYRFIFLAIPLWLLIGSDLVARAWERHSRRVVASLGTALTAISTAGILNALPGQSQNYYPYSHTRHEVRFLRRQAGTFAAYRYLARAPEVKSVWQPDRNYWTTPGYYYLHRKVPFYAHASGQHFIDDQETLLNLVSHIVIENPKISNEPGYILEKQFGDVRVLRRKHNSRPIRTWQDHTVILITPGAAFELRAADMDHHIPLPPNFGIRFTDSD